MKWYRKLTERLLPGLAYETKALINELKQLKPGLSKSGYAWALRTLTQEGLLTRPARGSYMLFSVSSKREYSPLYSPEAEKLEEVISKKYPLIRFSIFETSLLNDFLNQLIAQNTIFIQVEKESSIFVFRYLQELGYSPLLYRPSVKDFHLYWSKGCIVVLDLISEAPLARTNSHAPTLEKVLVDLVSDKLISTTFSQAELPWVVEQAEKSYFLDERRMLRYARRRKKESVILQYLGGCKNHASNSELHSGAHPQTAG